MLKSIKTICEYWWKFREREIEKLEYAISRGEYQKIYDRVEDERKHRHKGLGEMDFKIRKMGKEEK